MRYTIFIDQVCAIEWGLNLTEAALFSYCYNLPSWAKEIIFDNQTYHFAARQNAISEVPIITDKPDTIYRLYKKLNDKNLIIYKKIDGMDCIKLTQKAKLWNSEKNPNAEKNPKKTGKKSETPRKKIRKKPEKNPTYNNTIEKGYNKEKTTIEKKGAPQKNVDLIFDQAKNEDGTHQIILVAENYKVIVPAKELQSVVGKSGFFLLKEFFKAGGKFPFGEPMTRALISWLEHKKTRKDKYVIAGFNILIGKLSKMDEQYCCQLIENAIMNNYAGCMWPDTIAKYNKSKQYGDSKNGRRKGDFSQQFIKDMADGIRGL